MNKDQFLQKLDTLIKVLPPDERQDILQDYKEYFLLGTEAGKTEEQIASSLGSPNQIAKDLLASYHVDQAANKATSRNIMRALWSVIGLSFLNFFIILGPVIVLFGIVFSGWLLSFVLCITPLLALINLVSDLAPFQTFDLFISFILCGLGLFMIIAMVYTTRKLFSLLIRYLRFNISFIKGGVKNA
ncbi:DUF1700 domain-containing protein [Hazenella sp. IB182357]|uniref:DUF1700 domain-containing protein n=1 Tax=Polycladospora coralii TaxID=2771432 RepID=A0A926N6Q2_9BACL|nr:DUF1700 domain-containing protein [Polycladospora coralii]MBD1373444.1 DUF1700 domain-containing protein [Polycladospora coralii]